jgi:hypothetical protein
LIGLALAVPGSRVRDDKPAAIGLVGIVTARPGSGDLLTRLLAKATSAQQLLAPVDCVRRCEKKEWGQVIDFVKWEYTVRYHLNLRSEIEQCATACERRAISHSLDQFACILSGHGRPPDEFNHGDNTLVLRMWIGTRVAEQSFAATTQELVAQKTLEWIRGTECGAGIPGTVPGEVK